jgi:hypothetical protein
LSTLLKFVGGSFASGEVNAYASKDRPNFLDVDKDGNRNWTPALISGLADPNARWRYILSAGPAGAGTSMFGLTKGLLLGSAESYAVGTLSAATDYYRA